jgi:hypothetical protein
MAVCQMPLRLHQHNPVPILGLVHEGAETAVQPQTYTHSSTAWYHPLTSVPIYGHTWRYTAGAQVPASRRQQGTHTMQRWRVLTTPVGTLRLAHSNRAAPAPTRCVQRQPASWPLPICVCCWMCIAPLAVTLDRDHDGHSCICSCRLQGMIPPAGPRAHRCSAGAG